MFRGNIGPSLVGVNRWVAKGYEQFIKPVSPPVDSHCGGIRAESGNCCAFVSTLIRQNVEQLSGRALRTCKRLTKGVNDCAQRADSIKRPDRRAEGTQ